MSTDQEFEEMWDTYSDLYKDWNGIRPRNKDQFDKDSLRAALNHLCELMEDVDD